MKTLKSKIVALVAGIFLAVGLLFAPTAMSEAASSADIFACKVTRGGVGSFNGEWVSVKCTGAKFTNPKKYRKHQYRAYAWCDRVLWQTDRKAVGKWVYGNATSTAWCDAIGDWGAVRWGYEWK